jgi:hypothetical protein
MKRSMLLVLIIALSFGIYAQSAKQEALQSLEEAF